MQHELSLSEVRIWCLRFYEFITQPGCLSKGNLHPPPLNTHRMHYVKLSHRCIYLIGGLVFMLTAIWRGAPNLPNYSNGTQLI
jgi:hypothetical protein